MDIFAIIKGVSCFLSYKRAERHCRQWRLRRKLNGLDAGLGQGRQRRLVMEAVRERECQGEVGGPCGYLSVRCIYAYFCESY